MKKIFLALSLSLILCQPAQCSSGTTRFLQLYGSEGLVGCDSSSNHNLQFAPGTSQTNITAVTTASAAFDWSDQQDPDIVGFFTAVATDQNLPAAARVTLPLSEGLMIQQINNPTLINNYIADMLTSGAYPWLTPAAMEEILSLAEQYGIPIQIPAAVPGVTNLTGFKLTLLTDSTIPNAARVDLLKYAAILNDLIGYALIANPRENVVGTVTAGQNVVLPLTTLDATNMVVGAPIVITDNVSKEITVITAVNGNSLTVAGLANSYGATATVQALNLLQAAWFSIKSTDTVLQGNCTDGTLITSKIESIAQANNIALPYW